MKKINVKIELGYILGVKVKMPEYLTDGASGVDLASAEDLSLWPGRKTLVRTGLKMAIPYGYELQIRPRSGMAYKTNLVILNSPGTIDSDYRGEIKIPVKNGGNEILDIHKGDRIAQGIFTEVFQAEFQEEELGSTERGEGGFGHTGINNVVEFRHD